VGNGVVNEGCGVPRDGKNFLGAMAAEALTVLLPSVHGDLE
jgi:hypothetical protein